MIAQRLRPIGWVASVAGAALGFYLVSLQVATERASLETTERRIETTRREIRRLETEFAARASLRQLEAYNGQVLALAAPTAKQFLTNEVQLASYDPGLPDRGLGTALASAQVPAPGTPAPVATPSARPSFKPAVVADAGTADAPVIPAARRQPALTAVAYTSDVAVAPRPSAPARPKVKAPSPQAVAMLDDDTLGEIARRAAKEAKAAKR